jgi:hypothetical protein
MDITSAQYVASKSYTLADGEWVSENTGNQGIKATIDGQELFVPMTSGNRHYDEIMRQVDAGDLVIEQETQA